MRVKRRVRSFPGLRLAPLIVLFALFSCGDNGIPIKDLRGQIQGGAKRSVELVFAAKDNDPIVALLDSRKGFLFAASAAGDIYKISGVNKAERIYRGLVTCDKRWLAFALDQDGRLVTNTCRDDKDVLVTIDEQGGAKDLALVDGRVLALAHDATGKIYVAAWTSEGNVSISLNPRSLAGAEFILGKIFELTPDRTLTLVYEGGIPVWIATSRRGNFYAALWGNKGYFAPEKKTYSYVDPYRAYWLALSDRVKLVKAPDLALRFENSLIQSLSLFLIPEDEYLLGYGISKEGEGGIFLVEENRPPIKLLLQDQKFDKNITCLALFDNVVYFGNAEGGVYRIK